MKYYKFEKIIKGENPIIRITYKTTFGKFVVRDICKSQNVDGFWLFIDNGDLTHKFEPINTFYKNNLDVYFINGNIHTT